VAGTAVPGVTALAGVPADEAELLRRFHQRPQPQVAAGQILRESGATSCNDISDGLANELNEIAQAGGVRLRVQADRVPVAPAVRNFARRRGEDPLAYAWYGGEDYQLVGTAPSFAFARALARCESIGVKLTPIGRVEAGDGVVAEWPDGRLERIEPRGFNHFQD
ncbi:MAG: thiamine-phosphate kinase, partial [Alicyclobacillaceae bacterium]|nr:thiamine-phosphate kinase [Alicyclobacillaceae bacterium]